MPKWDPYFLASECPPTLLRRKTPANCNSETRGRHCPCLRDTFPITHRSQTPSKYSTSTVAKGSIRQEKKNGDEID